MAYNLEPRTIKENLLGLIGNNPYAEPRPAKTREECFLADIAENGGGLPEVTSDDNGDVLSVVAGAWAKSPAPSSLPPYTSADLGKVLTVGDGVVPKWEENGGIFVVNIGGTPQAPTADATFDQITTAISKGKLPVAVANGGSMILPCISQSATEYAFSLPSFTISGTSIVAIASYLVKIADDDTVTMIYGTRTFS